MHLFGHLGVAVTTSPSKIDLENCCQQTVCLFTHLVYVEQHLFIRSWVSAHMMKVSPKENMWLYSCEIYI